MINKPLVGSIKALIAIAEQELACLAAAEDEDENCKVEYYRVKKIVDRAKWWLTGIEQGFLDIGM